jgi:hypothetical protein
MAFERNDPQLLARCRAQAIGPQFDPEDREQLSSETTRPCGENDDQLAAEIFLQGDR